MPGRDMEYPDQQGGPDLYPKTEEEHAALVGWCLDSFQAADVSRRSKWLKWRKYHRVYRSFVERSQQASWRSAVFIPYAFSVIESITPRMVAQLPTFVCNPVGAEDVVPAKLMEQELQRDADQTDLYVELIKAMKTSLKYGTGILKNFYFEDIRRAYEMQPVMEPVDTQQPVMNPTSGETARDITGSPMMETQQQMQPVIGPDGQPVMQQVPYEYLVYSGPKSAWVDPFHFWVAPEATDLEDARFTIERFFREVRDIEKKILQGIYKLPPGIQTVSETFPEEEDIREQVIGEGNASKTDSTRRACELLEFHTSDNRIITLLNKSTVIRVQENPYWHGEKPYAVFPDYLQEGEFWGMGEIEAIEGLQDLLNALYNQRVDNVRLTMDAMFAINEKAIPDERDLLLKPGGIIRIAGDYMPQEAIQRLDFGDVTSGAFEEAGQVEALIERVSGVSAYQLGIADQNQSMNRTATGVSLITEAGNNKFALKVRLMELVGMRRLARQWGAIIQQYLNEERQVRVLGPNGQWLFPTMTPDSIQGNLDYSIDAASSTQTESARKEQATMLFQTLAPALPQAVPKLAQDLLEAFGKKDFVTYLMGSPDLMLMMQAMASQQTGGVVLPFQQPGQGGQQGQGGPPQQGQGGGYGGAQQPAGGTA